MVSLLMRPAPSQYSRTAKWLHWLIAILIIGQLAGGIFMLEFAKGQLKFSLYQWHKTFGISILILSLARLGWRLAHRPPELPQSIPALQRRLAKVSHFVFYFLIVAVPLAGWLMVSASPRNLPTQLFGIIPWPNFPFVSQSKEMKDLFAVLHKYLAFATMALLIVHICAALHHHFILRDGVMSRMLPRGKEQS